MKQLIEVFKTNVHRQPEAERLLSALLNYFPSYRINFDLHDCDKILRIESQNGSIDNERVMEAVGDFGYLIEELPD